MKKRINKILSYTLFTSLVFLGYQVLLISQTEEDYKVLSQANKAYVEGNFQTAVEKYETLINSGLSSADLYYNLGNSYYRVGNYKAAILNYERAKLLKPNDENILTNLEFSERYVQDKIEDVPKFFLVRWIDAFTNMFSEKTWAIISILTFISFLLLIILFLFSKTLIIRKISFYFGVITIFLSLVSFYSSYRQNTKLTNHNTAIVFSPAVTVKSSPLENGTDLFIIHEGLKVIITDSSDGWKEIKLSDGKVGWLPAETIVVI
ncbi:MAG: tetratricopeptide repeat protein [Bacteroidales bacterium]|nr:tetratricopeptide repeat protein [Bacteroidales bacterium]